MHSKYWDCFQDAGVNGSDELSESSGLDLSPEPSRSNGMLATLLQSCQDFNDNASGGSYELPMSFSPQPLLIDMDMSLSHVPLEYITIGSEYETIIHSKDFTDSLADQYLGVHVNGISENGQIESLEKPKESTATEPIIQSPKIKSPWDMDEVTTKHVKPNGFLSNKSSPPSTDQPAKKLKMAEFQYVIPSKKAEISIRTPGDFNSWINNKVKVSKNSPAENKERFGKSMELVNIFDKSSKTNAYMWKSARKPQSSSLRRLFIFMLQWYFYFCFLLIISRDDFGHDSKKEVSVTFKCY